MIHNGLQNETLPWNDSAGRPINAHDGGVIFDGGFYHWYGLALRPLPAIGGPDGGQKTTTGVVMYRSRDLSRWEYEGVVLSCRSAPGHPLFPPMRFERPKIVHNPLTGKYVMWFHYVSYPGDHTGLPMGGEAGVAVANAVNGPYRFLRVFRPIDDDGVVRDCTLYRDDDGRGYFIYDRDVVSRGDRRLFVVELSGDYLSCVSHREVADGVHREAPVVMKKNGLYYLVTSGLSGWAPNQAIYYTAPRIVGPYTRIGDPCVGEGSHVTYNSQGTHAFGIEGRPGEFVFMAERHHTPCMTDCSYIWLRPEWDDAGRLTIPYRQDWDLSGVRRDPSEEAFK